MLVTCFASSLKRSGAVSVVEPGLAISSMFLKTARSKGSAREGLGCSSIGRPTTVRSESAYRLAGSLKWMEQGKGDQPADSKTKWTSRGKCSSSILCSLGVWKWNCLRLYVVPSYPNVPFTSTSTVVPRFLNSAPCS